MIGLIGTEHTKRTDYFLRAAQSYNSDVQLFEWTEVFAEFEQVKEKLGQAAIKIDPPSYQIIKLLEMKGQLEQYKICLNKLDTAAEVFLNTPAAIQFVLDKRKTKQILHRQNILTTELFLDKLLSAKQLVEQMQERKIYNVFIKPSEFSGAAGVMAFRIHPKTSALKLYTACQMTSQGLFNTKKLSCIEDKDSIIKILDQLVKMDAMVERWHAKETIFGKSYDLRVVFQFGKIAHIVVRCSDGPITNLHLNNQAAQFSSLCLDNKKIEEIEVLCAKACHAIPGLQVAGLDVMLDKGSKTPRIIEINGQGDLIYQDIFAENKIYRQQIEYLKAQYHKVE